MYREAKRSGANSDYLKRPSSQEVGGCRGYLGSVGFDYLWGTERFQSFSLAPGGVGIDAEIANHLLTRIGNVLDNPGDELERIHEFEKVLE